MELNNDQIKELGIYPSAIYSLLISESKTNDFFSFSKEKIISETRIKRSNLQASLKKLVSAGYIEMKVFGLPATTHFKILK